MSNSIEKFKKSDLKVGHVVKLRNGELRMVCQIGKIGSLILTDGKKEWNYLSNWDEFLCASASVFNLYSPAERRHLEFDIVEVYGHITRTYFYHMATDVTTDYRPLLWNRVPIKEMTLAEIENKLGYRIKLVAED